MSEVATPDTSAGELLRRYREAAGLQVDTLAANLKVPVRKLKALEQDQHDQLTDAVFARALASSVCRTLKVDAQPVLERLPQTHAPRLLQDHEGLNAPFRAPGDGAAPGWTEQLTRPVFLVVYALLLGALVLVFLPRTRTDDAVAAKKTDTAAPAPMTDAALVPVSSANDTPAAVSPDTVPVPEPSNPGPIPPVATSAQPPRVAGAMNTPAGAAARPGAATSPKSSAAPAAVAAAAAPAAASSAPAASGLVVFRTTGPSWIEVTDSRGTTTLRRLMSAGESAGASGSPPLAVTIGSVNVTSVQVRGKPFDLARFSRDNVARFEVK